VLTAPPMFMVQAPLACGAVKSMVEDSIKLTQCLIAAEKAGALGELISQSGGGSGTSTAQICQTAGKISLKIAKSVLSKQIAPNNPATQVLGYFSKIRGAGAISDATSKKLAALSACQ
jgi:hypothetical protein